MIIGAMPDTRDRLDAVDKATGNIEKPVTLALY